MKLINDNEIEGLEKSLQGNKDSKAVLYFTAAWCGPCQRFGPLIEEVEKEETETEFRKVDVDTASQIAEKYGVRSVPTVIFLKGGEIAEQSRPATKKEIKDTIARL